MATDLLLTYNDPASDPWILNDLPLLKQCRLQEMAALAGLSERRLRDIYAGRATPHQTTKERLLSVLSDLLPAT